MSRIRWRAAQEDVVVVGAAACVDEKESASGRDGPVLLGVAAASQEAEGGLAFQADAKHTFVVQGTRTLKSSLDLARAKVFAQSPTGHALPV